MYVNGPPLFAVEQNNAQLAVVALELAAGVDDMTALELIAAEEAAPLETAVVEVGTNEIIELLGVKVDSELETEVTGSELKVTVGYETEEVPLSKAELAAEDTDEVSSDTVELADADTDSDKVALETAGTLELDSRPIDEELPDSTAEVETTEEVEVADVDSDPEMTEVPEVDVDSDNVKLLEADAEYVSVVEIAELPEFDADSEISEDDINGIEELKVPDERVDAPVSIAELCERTAELEIISMEELAATDVEEVSRTVEVPTVDSVGTKVESDAVLPGSADVSRAVEVSTVDSVDNVAEDWTGKSEVATFEERTFDEVAAVPEDMGVFELITVEEPSLTGFEVLAAAEEDPGAVERTLLLVGTASEDKVLLTEIYTEDNCDSEILKVGSTEEGSIDERLDTTAELGRVGSTLSWDDTGPIDEDGLPELLVIDVDSGRSLPEEVGSEVLLVVAGFEVDWLETIGAVVDIDSGPALDVGKPEDVATVEDGAAEQKLG
ncbi:uncharacterized protein EAE97_009443 [Botrytis byssoidea]|uniref:Uncharacterized protein n=1 Tax=Botrytis byssoidea TaxID=139641 RepID=A0A9P5LVX1_9HELO|nr:uncharacterized protein EAE97_009443 [Botrytis byssoidea]KAF7929846.1 hypothetical protein EAE97_009443 [Botrytis byssoidea]